MNNLCLLIVLLGKTPFYSASLRISAYGYGIHTRWCLLQAKFKVSIAIILTCAVIEQVQIMQ